MSREEVQKLLGGYATGTLTAEEQQALFEAALEDQGLFDALAREQGLRDLLRDPAAKAEVLAALDERPARGFWAWLRRPPVVAGIAMAGVAAISVVVWQGSRKPVAAPATPAPPSSMVAQLRPQTPEPHAEVAAPAQPKPLGDEKRAFARGASTDSKRQLAPVKERAEFDAAAPVVAQAKPAELNFQQNVQNSAPAPPPSASNMGQISNQTQSPQNRPTSTSQTVEVQAAQVDDARTLFYKQFPINGRSAFVPSEETSKLKDELAGSAGQPAQNKSAKKAIAPAPAPAPQRAAALGGAFGGALIVHLGVRCSILRGDREVDLSTPLFAGESVRLRLTPNADGFVSVYEGEGDSARLVASGQVQRMKPFETPALKSDAPGQKQFRVTLAPMSALMTKSGLVASGDVSRANLVESTAERESATYVVTRDALPAQQQVVVPITLTWR